MVTARKREELLIDVPQTVQAVSLQEISKAGIENLEDLGRQVTNVTLNTRSDNEPNVVIRGVGSFGNTQGVGFYFDDVQNFTDQSTRIEDVERSEEHTSELQSLMRISYAVFCLKNKKKNKHTTI